MSSSQKGDYGFPERFRAMSDVELVDAFNNQVGNNGWVSACMSYLWALHAEFKGVVTIIRPSAMSRALVSKAK